MTITGTELEHTVEDLNPNVYYTVECTSSNGEESCDSTIDTIRSDLHFVVNQQILKCIFLPQIGLETQASSVISYSCITPKKVLRFEL